MIMIHQNVTNVNIQVDSLIAESDVMYTFPSNVCKYVLYFVFRDFDIPGASIKFIVLCQFKSSSTHNIVFFVLVNREQAKLIHFFTVPVV